MPAFGVFHPSDLSQPSNASRARGLTALALGMLSPSQKVMHALTLERMYTLPSNQQQEVHDMTRSADSAARDSAVRVAADEILWEGRRSLVDEATRFLAGAIVGDSPKLEAEVGRRIRSAVLDSLSQAIAKNWSRNQWNDAAVDLARDYMAKYGQPSTPTSRQSQRPHRPAISVIPGGLA